MFGSPILAEDMQKRHAGDVLLKRREELACLQERVEQDMENLLTTTNTIIAIIVGCISIIGSIAGVLGKRSSALRRSEAAPVPVQVEVREKWSGFSLIWRIWVGVFAGVFGTVVCTAAADILISIGLSVYYSTQQIDVVPDFLNPTVLIIAAIFGIMSGITGGVNAAIGRDTAYSYRQW